jgi:predicted transcriptional regulator
MLARSATVLLDAVREGRTLTSCADELGVTTQTVRNIILRMPHTAAAYRELQQQRRTPRHRPCPCPACRHA